MYKNTWTQCFDQVSQVFRFLLSVTPFCQSFSQFLAKESILAHWVKKDALVSFDKAQRHLSVSLSFCRFLALLYTTIVLGLGAHKSELAINPGRNQNLPLFLEQTA